MMADILRYSPVHDNNWPISVFVAALMHIDYEIINARRMAQFRPTGTVQHANVKLIVVLYRLHHKVTAHVITFIHFGHVVDSIVIAANGQRIIRPKLRERLQMTTQKNMLDKVHRLITVALCKLTMSSSDDSRTIVCTL